jgi:hypothetical protein
MKRWQRPITPPNLRPNPKNLELSTPFAGSWDRELEGNGKMIDEHGFDLSGPQNGEQAKIITAVLPHPIHGRLTERLIPLVRSYLSFGGCPYMLCWRDHGVAYYTPIG